MDTIILNYSQKKKDLISKLLRKFQIEGDSEGYFRNQIDSIIEYTLCPSTAGAVLQKHKSEVFRELKKAYETLESQFSNLKSSGNIHGDYPVAFTPHYVSVVESLMAATNKFRNDHKTIIKQLRDPFAVELTKESFDVALEIVSEFTRIETKALLKPCRKREVCDARKLFVICLFCFYKTSLVGVGRFLGKNHATILHYITDKKIRQYDNKKKKTLALQV
jgi:hypothetical protein